MKAIAVSVALAACLWYEMCERRYELKPCDKSTSIIVGTMWVLFWIVMIFS